MTDELAVQEMKEEAKDNDRLEQNEKEQPISFLAKVIITGFIGGVFWSSLGYFAYTFQFTSVSPNLVLTPFAIGDWKYEPLGQIVGIFLLGVLGILVALLYFATLRNMKSIWTSIFYGAILWALVFYILNPMFPDLEVVTKLNMNTNITNLCLFILFGVFVGYSISFEQTEMKREHE